MTSPLRNELLEMGAAERDARIARLRHMREYELQHENNIACNNALQVELGLRSVAAFIGMKPSKRKAKERKGGAKKRKGDDGDEYGEEEESGDESEGNCDTEDEEDHIARSPVPTRSRAQKKAGPAAQAKAPKAPVKASNKSKAAANRGTPSWAADAREMLADEALGEQWGDVVETGGGYGV